MAAPTTSVKLKNKTGTDVTYSGVNDIEVLTSGGSIVVFSYADFASVTATASDVMPGKYFLTKNKELTEGTMVLAQLNSPTINLPSGSSILSLADGDNGTFSQQYNIYVDGTYKVSTPISSVSYDLSTISGVSSGTHAIIVTIAGSGIQESQGAMVSYVKSLQTPTITISTYNANISFTDTHIKNFDIVIDNTTNVNMESNGYVFPTQDTDELELYPTVYTASFSNGTINIT